MAAGHDDDQLSGVLDLLERLRERPTRRHRERLRPLVFLLGPLTSTRKVAEAIGRRCAEQRAPVSRIAADTESDLAGVLREARRELSRPRCHPKWEPALGFPLLEMVLWLRELREFALGERQPETAEDHANADLATDLTRRGYDAGDELRRAIRRHRRRGVRRGAREEGDKGKFAGFFDHLDQVAPIGVAVVALVSLTAATTLDLAAAVVAAAVGLAVLAGRILAGARGWLEVRRYRWLVGLPYIPEIPAADFHDFALEVVTRDDRNEPKLDDHLDLLLVAAFLEDLRHSYRRGVRRAAWARVNYPLLIFDHLTTGHIGCRFIEIAERVRASSQAERGQPDFDPLAIVAGADPATPAEPGDPTAPSLLDRLTAAIAVGSAGDRPVGLEEAATVWQRHIDDQRRLSALGARRALLVNLAEDRVPDFDAVRDDLRPARDRPWAAHPALPWAAMVSILIPSATAIGYTTTEGCRPPEVWRAGSGECVGITDGSFVFNSRLGSVERRIKQDNIAVLKSGKPYITVVYLGPLTPDPSAKPPQQDLLSSAQGELVGLSIAQRDHNGIDNSPLGVRILLANTGDKMLYAQRVAGQIRARQAHDRHIVGVVGFEQSRVETQGAITDLSRAALPMIGTANSYDRTAWQQGTDFSPYYFRLAPPNSRLAEHDANWAGGATLGAKTVTVFYNGDPSDLYSQNLATDFANDFARRFGRRPTVTSYAKPSEVPEMVRRACAHPSDLFFYAGRSEEFGAFINQIDTTTCGSGARTVLADDEIAKYVNDNARQIGGDQKIKLFYTPLALEQAWTPTWVGNEPPHPFFEHYRQTVQEIHGKNSRPDMLPSATRAAVSYDAALIFINVAERIFGSQQDRHGQPTPAAVLAELIEPSSGPPLQGASGVLSFGPRLGGHEVADKPVMLATVQPSGTVAVRAVCGLLVPHPAHQRDCPAGG